MPKLHPIDPAIVERKRRLLNVATERVIEADPAQVWAIIADAGTWTDWHEDYDEHEPIGEPVAGLGARFRTREWIIRTESEVVRWEPNRTLGLMVDDANWIGRFIRSYYTQLDLEPVTGEHGKPACRVRYRVAIKGTVLFWLLCAYTIAQTTISVYLAGRASLRKLDRLAAGPVNP